MNKTAENILKAQDKQMNDAIASKLAIENHKKYTELILKRKLRKQSGERKCRESNRIYWSCTNPTTNCR